MGGAWCGRGLWSEKRWSLELRVNFTQNRKPRKLSCRYLSETREELEAQQEESGRGSG